jgi:hypothetical protein
MSSRWLAAKEVSTNIGVATGLAELYCSKGLPCEIEAGPGGVIVYAGSRIDADRIARDIRRAVVERDPRACTERARFDEDEPKATAWWAAVNFSWRVF